MPKQNRKSKSETSYFLHTYYYRYIFESCACLVCVCRHVSHSDPLTHFEVTPRQWKEKKKKKVKKKKKRSLTPPGAVPAETALKLLRAMCTPPPPPGRISRTHIIYNTSVYYYYYIHKRARVETIRFFSTLTHVPARVLCREKGKKVKSTIRTLHCTTTPSGLFGAIKIPA